MTAVYCIIAIIVSRIYIIVIIIYNIYIIVIIIYNIYNNSHNKAMSVN